MKNQSKRLGQVFLKDKNILDKIIHYAELEPSDVVIEIGCGEGDLTHRLVTMAAHILVIEIDGRCVGATKERLLASDLGFSDVCLEHEFVVSNSTIVDISSSKNSKLETTRCEKSLSISTRKRQVTFEKKATDIFPVAELYSETLKKRVSFFLVDFLKLSLKELLLKNLCAKNNQKIEFLTIKIVANVPYYISAKIIQKLAKEKRWFQFAVLMYQKEFGEKLKANPGEKIYTSLTVFSRYHFLLDYGFSVSRRSFFPVPKVDSCVIKLTPQFWGRDNKVFTLIERRFVDDVQEPGFVSLSDDDSEILGDSGSNTEKDSGYLGKRLDRRVDSFRKTKASRETRTTLVKPDGNTMSLKNGINEDLLFSIVQTAFWARRKTFMKCLKTSPFIELSGDLVESFSVFEGRPTVRGEVLGLGDFFEVYREALHGVP
ncbi:hypothetical protein HOH45_03090 [bacterium]|nr:hypothetical protein [bacterium]